jgi:NTP pyrophosphatase (non-canonical NTP hydrolase)
MLEEQIQHISELRLKMWPPDKSDLNITEIDHLLGTLVEEAGEFRGAVRSFLGRPFNPEKKATREDMIEELGDILVPVIGMAAHTDITLEEALASVEAKLEKRANKKFPNNFNSQ